MSNIAIVILNWNGLNFLELFLPAVIKHSQGARIIVADNNSNDGSVDFIKKAFPAIEIICIPINEGYSKGYNIALRQVNAEFYILLNSDVEVCKGWMEPIIHLMQNDLSIAACQPKIKSYIDKESFEYAGAAGGFIDKFGYPFCRGRIFNEVEKDNGQYNDICEIFWASGACLFIRSEIYWQVGGLDDDFFAHMEEIDLCWRIKNAGYKIYYYGYSEVFHVGGGTLNKSNPTKTYLNFRNGLSLLYKNLPENEIGKIIFLRMALDGLAAFKFLFFDSVGHFWAVLRSHFYFYKHIRKLRKKREEIKPKILQFAQPLVLKQSIVIAHFLWKKNLFSQLKHSRKY